MQRVVETTPLNQMRSIGNDAERSITSMNAVMRQNMPDGLGATLAIPQPRKDGTAIDWYVDIDEPLARLTDLPADLAAKHRARVNAIALRVEEAASRLADRGAAGGAMTLRNAVTVPGESNVWIGGDATRDDAPIVIAGWGHVRHDAEAVGGASLLSGAGVKRPVAPVPVPAPTAPPLPTPPPMTPIVVVPERRRGWGSWLAWLLLLLLLLLALAIAWLLLPACGVRIPLANAWFGWGGGAWCGHDRAVVEQVNDDRERLLTEIRGLEEQLRRRRLTCVAPEPEPLPPPAPVPDPAPDPEPEPEPVLPPRTDLENRGEYQITLLWNDRSDLDLYVYCPNGEEIGHSKKRQLVCGGTLDLDANNENETDTPVENIKWETTPAPGTYRIEVKLWKRKGVTTPRIPFDVHIKEGDGAQTKIIPGTVSQENNQDPSRIYEFTVPG